MDSMNASAIPPAHPATGGFSSPHPPDSELRLRDERPVAPAKREMRLTRSQELKSRVLAELMRSGYSALTWIGCEIREDKVILQGSVPSYYLKQLAQVYAQRVDGVELIQNRLEVSRRLPA
jgi:osmotically-inducible protein OsmY